MTKRIHLLYADGEGHLFEEKELTALGLNGREAVIADERWIDLPEGGELVLLPGRSPMGFDEAAGELEVVEESVALAALLPVGYTRALLPGYEIQESRELPLFGYTAVGAADGRLKVAAFQTDEDRKWNPLHYNTADLPERIAAGRRRFPENRILEQLARCALEYHCLTAQNIFYRRWEAGIPVSPVCNCDCMGCISQQPAECCPAPQSRIRFVPGVREVAELAAAHLAEAEEGIVSFGQGCEGEPSLQSDLLAEAIAAVRRQTGRGTVNINSNAGDTRAIARLADAGLDSIRVSLFSAIPEDYQWYHRPRGYGLADVVASLRHAAGHGLQTSLNLLLFPGFTNQPRQTEALYRLIAETGLFQLQLRNLNLDPEKLEPLLGEEETPEIADWLAGLKQAFPQLRIGNYSQPKRA
jgi:pyruvate-formate lyase-activating enzyme